MSRIGQVEGCYPPPDTSGVAKALAATVEAPQAPEDRQTSYVIASSHRAASRWKVDNPAGARATVVLRSADVDGRPIRHGDTFVIVVGPGESLREPAVIAYTLRRSIRKGGFTPTPNQRQALEILEGRA